MMNEKLEIGKQKCIPWRINKNLSLFFAIFFVIFLSACSNSSNDEEPAHVVQIYFQAWNERGNEGDYETMYAVISDGFKKIEPTAATVEDFTNYANSQGIEEVTINSISQNSNDGEEALVFYNVTFQIKGKSVPFTGTYTLKYKERDAIPGWKLIHPYGEHIDTS